MDPKLFKMFFKERYRKLISAIKKKADVKVALHSCGSVAWVLDDLADAGFDVLHPLQGDERKIRGPYQFLFKLKKPIGHSPGYTAGSHGGSKRESFRDQGI
ncbi:MAG: uroporphyrinogen decarboxylase family protein [bacterium]